MGSCGDWCEEEGLDRSCILPTQSQSQLLSTNDDAPLSPAGYAGSEDAPSSTAPSASKGNARPPRGPHLLPPRSSPPYFTRCSSFLGAEVLSGGLACSRPITSCDRPSWPWRSFLMALANSRMVVMENKEQQWGSGCQAKRKQGKDLLMIALRQSGGSTMVAER